MGIYLQHFHCVELVSEKSEISSHSTRWGAAKRCHDLNKWNPQERWTVKPSGFATFRITMNNTKQPPSRGKIKEKRMKKIRKLIYNYVFKRVIAWQEGRIEDQELTDALYTYCDTNLKEAK